MNARQFLITEDMVLLEDEKAYILTIEDLEELLTDFAEHKAFEAWKAARARYSQKNYAVADQAIKFPFNKWWENEL